MPGDLDTFVEGLDYPVFVVTAAAGEDRDGCLVGFATQCSIDPPRLLVCLSKRNRTYRIAVRSRRLAVHRLAAHQHGTAALFGSRTGDDVDKLGRCAWRPAAGGVPLIDGCPATVVADVVDRVDLGDHEGFVLAPVTVEVTAAGPALTFTQVRDLAPGHPA